MPPGRRLSTVPGGGGDVAVHVLGIRHHGPGSARSLERALVAIEPDLLLIELPADVQPLLRWVRRDDLVPPVALLGYLPREPSTAVFLPFASFSPEWVALRHAARAGIDVQAIDLPLKHLLADRIDETRAEHDPVAELAAAAGDDDPERWWDDAIEHRVADAGAPALAPFDALAAAMGALRGPAPSGTLEARREAWMRQAIRKVLRSGAHRRIAVVCGAWHVPALVAPLPPATTDAPTLRHLPKVSVDVAWVPWSHQRLASTTGYGAGVGSPAWYAHVFTSPPHERIERWFVAAAHTLRASGHDTSPDHLIAATRLASTLAQLRRRPQAGLAEALDALTAVLGEGGAVPMALVHDELVVGRAIGEVPPDAPMVPLAKDLAAQQRHLRLKPSPEHVRLELDLRTRLGLDRSHLLHRLIALDVPWGRLDDWRGSSGTFREMWALDWRPELAVPLVERAAFGTTVASAAEAYLAERARGASMAELVHLLDVALAADLPAAVSALVDSLRHWVAAAPDLGDVIDSLGPLARAIRYGDVRGSDLTSLRAVFDALVVHVLAGLGLACRSLDEHAAAAMAARLGTTQVALGLVEHPARDAEWPRELLVVAARPAVPAIVRGRAVRLARDASYLSPTDAGRWLSRALSPSVAATDAAGFVEGFLAGSGTLLGHDRALLDLVDGWLSSLATAEFDTIVPLLRRTFAEFEPAERRRIGAAIAGGPVGEPPSFGYDPDRATLAVATIRAMLGAPP